ncbi:MULTISPECIES: shikimate dehydrogenase [Lysobacteraceae]|uniref:Shikimate dehydrogenase (NADP(+)) n=1 Tax=Novilysobacter avium TaxID=2781023 RepID=A0A7S6ZUX4_9GAMM|nr:MULTISPECIES: shikimate dehydrogenase [Lysobacter]QOW22159.1 shikimate dehydrogenase [Lysobacter avium]QOW24639.1 shikimate dehydrogenase [Lysobacter sp. H23M47]
MSTPRFALIGHPVAHSLSPRIHAAFARQTGIAMDYGLIDATAEEFDDALAGFAAAGGKGANVTLPHKARAAAACESLSDRARRCGVVNTLTRTATGWAGDNTDGLGLVRDLTDRHGQDLRGRRVLLIGAGGVAHGVAPALLDAGIAGLMIVNRTDSRTDALADLLGDPARVHPRNFADLHTQGVFDLIINATSIGHAADGGELPLPQSLIAPRGDVVDLGYGEASIGFLAWARAGGADQMMDGLGMLVEQAAESFKVWHGVRPSTDEIYAELRAESGATTVA